VDWNALAEYARSVRTARVGEEPAPEKGALRVAHAQVARYRMRATHLDRRLPAGHYADAAHGGLQDSTPRDAVLALHARLDAVDPAGWEHPDLAQIWLRGADYVVPRRALAAFTRGVLPREPTHRRALHELADSALAVLDGKPMPSRKLAAAIPGLPNVFYVRMLSATGRIHIRWDASRIDVVPAPPDNTVDGNTVDDEAARVELAHRFLHWHGPAAPAHLARWAGTSRADAEATWRQLASRHDLVPVDLDGRARWLLAHDEPTIRADAPIDGVRLLPAGDPVRYLDKRTVICDPPRHLSQRRPDATATQRLLNSLWGRVILDGRIVASWGRTSGNVTIAAWHHLTDADRDRVTAAAQQLAQALPYGITIRWLPDPDHLRG
jgi:hypothetical protein